MPPPHRVLCRCAAPFPGPFMPPSHRVLCRSEFSRTEAHSSALPPLAVPVSITRSGGRRERNTGCNVHGSPQNPAKAQQPYHMLGAAGCSCSCMHAYEPVAHHGRRQCPNSAPAGPTWPHVKQQHLDCKQVEGVLHHGEPCSKAPAAAAKHTEISKRSNGDSMPAVQCAPRPSAWATKQQLWEQRGRFGLH